MDWIEAPGSSTIARFSYDSSTKTLTVVFLKSGTYNYFDVPEAVFEQFKSASSKGQFLAQSIKGNYRYARG
ncbi:MAG: KTSC domain-containing protein [Gemmatimonadetes bacterium]|nr:KTSC domain-containing protein [Gemmatimonadota bacterium]